MRINFVLPQIFVNTPIGGYKIIYRYCNALVAAGNDVTICFLSNSFAPFNRPNPFQLLRFVYHKFIKYHKAKIEWYDLDPKIKTILEKTPLKSTFPNADIIIATAASTAQVVDSLPRSKGRHFYFVQHDESTFDIDYNTIDTWSLDMHIMTIATWIKKRIEKVSKKSIDIVPNFIDAESFGLDVSPEQRSPVLSMLYNPQAVKGFSYGVAALEEIKKNYPNVRIIMFGTFARPQNIPFEFEYISKANNHQLRKIYNESSIYILPSILEGWGLTAMDAMQCGAALVTTENGGVDDFTIDNFSAIKVPTRSGEALAQGIEKMLQDDDFRVKIAKNGTKSIQKFTFENSFKKFMDSITQSEEI
ncbi:MAG: glycosyltransferase family 4 protein [Oenococcus oeni]